MSTATTSPPSAFSPATPQRIETTAELLHEARESLRREAAERRRRSQARVPFEFTDTLHRRTPVVIVPPSSPASSNIGPVRQARSRALAEPLPAPTALPVAPEIAPVAFQPLRPRGG